MAFQAVNTTAKEIAHLGVWGPVTATLDWCEANYQFSHYIAEMANTFSNLFSIFVAFQGAIHSYKQDLPTRYTFGCIGISLVGIGSFLFHATLLYEAQLADELPMIYAGSYSLFLLFDTQPGWGIGTTRTKWLIFALVMFDVLFTWSYYLYRNPIYHQCVFGILVITTTLRTMHILRSSSTPPLSTHTVPENVKSEIGRLFAKGAGTFTLGFAVWNLDNVFCNVLTGWKVRLGWPGAFLLEGHSWWHVLTGVGAYLMLVGMIYVTLCVKDDHSKYEVAHDKYSIPYIRRVSLPREKADSIQSK